MTDQAVDRSFSFGSAPAPEIALEMLLPLMRAKGVSLAPADFHSTVNLVFHKYEAREYDRIHRDMWKSLPRQFELLVDDYLRRHLPDPPLKVLDVGCGTGLSAALLLRTQLAPYIGSVDLLDTSPEMLNCCRHRRRMQVARRYIQGTIDDVPEAPAYDVIVACSLLHHIPDLRGFAHAVAARQKPGGMFLHLQDPNADSDADPKRHARVRECEIARDRWLHRSARRYAPHRIVVAALRRTGAMQSRSYIDEINGELLRAGVIQQPLAAPDLWSITDLHEHYAPGISIATMGRLLPGYDLVSCRSYCFFGELESESPARFRKIERELAMHRSLEGCRIGAIWIRKGDSPV